MSATGSCRVWRSSSTPTKTSEWGGLQHGCMPRDWHHTTIKYAKSQGRLVPTQRHSKPLLNEATLHAPVRSSLGLPPPPACPWWPAASPLAYPLAQMYRGASWQRALTARRQLQHTARPATLPPLPASPPAQRRVILSIVPSTQLGVRSRLLV